MQCGKGTGILRRGSILVVGAGFAGATYARTLAEAGWGVEVIDRRSHLAGTALDLVDRTGTRRHVFGPHLFHTSNSRVMTWLRRFGRFQPYEHRVTALVAGIGCLPLPINRVTVNGIFGTAYRDTAAVAAHLARIAVPCDKPRNAAEHLYARIGRRLTDLFYRPYSLKMWGRPLEELDAAVVARVPIRHDDEDRYFLSERFQVLPVEGYTQVVRSMLDHPAIRVTLNRPFDRADLAGVRHCFTSMAIDDYFGAAYGALPYRSLRFHNRTVAAGYHLGPTAQVNLTDASPYTRESDWSKLPGHHDGRTAEKTVTLEEPCDPADNGGERFYPLRDSAGASDRLYRRYAALARNEPKLTFIGRCGTFRYLDMDQVINQSLQGARAWIARHG